MLQFVKPNQKSLAVFETKMTELDVIVDKSSLPVFELNNNNLTLERAEKSYSRKISESGISVSSASSVNSDSSEDNEGLNFGDNTTTKFENEGSKEGSNVRKYRSMSDVQTEKFLGQNFTEVFPSLPDSVLEKLKLLGDGARERINEEEIEQKFTALGLAFTIDSTTVNDRCERQKRYRDQTDTNLINEINKLVEKVIRIQPLCQNTNTAELLTGILAQVDVIIRASLYAAISAEKYGAVQHEIKLSDAVNLMIKHVNLLKQQRDSARKQLQLTKKLLQESTSSDSLSMKSKILPNGKAGCGRRASVAVTSQSNDNNKFITSETRKLTRRTSDLTSRLSTYMRSSRPNRSEMDLYNIKEGIGQRNLNKNIQVVENIEEIEEIASFDENSTTTVNMHASTFRQKIAFKLDKIANNLQARYEKSTKNGSLHDIFYFGSLLCFGFGIIIFINLLIEFELDRINTNTYPHTYWDTLLKFAFGRS